MTEHPPIASSARRTAEPHDYLPAAGRDILLPFYDRFTALLGVPGLHRTLIEQADLAEGQRLLEIGCGTGNLSLLARRTRPGVEVVGSDPDPLALARARRKARGLDQISFEGGYAQELPYADGSFDRAFSALMLHHLDRDTKVAAAAELLRVLRPGGSLHVVDFAGSQAGLHGALTRRMARAGHLADNADGGPVRLLDAAGFACEVLGTRRHPVLGEVTFYRATRP
ncbi:class I SAM-dependent methyltransferase [Streptacidiphilus sp. MAP12-33]|uniref:class I SAM-dependent methyltransferase n=1 Tax=Streptacidiphilus sp. MAP12-33 TaxID=3156266 RepID=UPI0035124540